MPADNPGGHVSDRDRVVAGITGAIAAGEYAPGAKLPSIEQLSQQYQTSKTTVKSALAILRALGTIRGHSGKGTFVPGDAPNEMGDDAPAGEESSSSTGGPTLQG